MNNKHAYLIMAHYNFEVLRVLLKTLDHSRNDIFLHIDVKSNFTDTDFMELRSLLQESSLMRITPMDVRWGDMSQVTCEITLLEAAIKGKYMYYHLVSGADLPIKRQEYILSFFDRNNGKEFVHFDSAQVSKDNIDKVNQYYLLQGFLRVFENKQICKVISKTNRLLVQLQRLFGVRRYKQDYVLQKGANWFSITHDFASYLISRKSWIQTKFRFTANPDEFFVQTVLINSTFSERLFNNDFDDSYEACQRLIDWTRGNPYVWRSTDFNQLMDSGLLFARKFDSNVDFQVVEMVYQALNEKT